MFFPVYAYVSFCLDYEEIYLFFVIVLLGCAINHVFLHTVNILWILLFKKDDIKKVDEIKTKCYSASTAAVSCVVLAKGGIVSRISQECLRMR